MHWPVLGTVSPYQAIPHLRVKYASKSKLPRVGESRLSAPDKKLVAIDADCEPRYCA